MVKQTRVVGAVILRGGMVLCAQRSLQSSLPGLWEFPGGKVEAGESAREALGREIREELLVDVLVGDLVETTVHEYPFGEVTLTTFYCELRSGEVTLTEHEAVRWLPPSELHSLDWAPADIPAVQTIMKRFATA